MIPAPTLRAQCPHCKTVKELSNLISGNTIGVIAWSDTQVYYPMLPQNSAVQHCPHCGKYFFLEDAKILPSCKKDKDLSTLFDDVVGKLFDEME